MSLTYYEIAVIAFTSLVFLGLLLISVVRGGRDDHRPGNYSPHVTVIVPCRGGKDLTLERNLRSLVSQDYGGDYRVIAVVDSLDDPAVETIRRVGLELMVSDARCEACSGKVRAIATVLERVRSEVYVFADSDAEMPPNWLRDLVAPLGDSETGLSTTFPPIFYPMGGFWSHVKMAWGLVGMGLMESRITRFGWGRFTCVQVRDNGGRGSLSSSSQVSLTI
ncbi:glycosyltransferase family 2 protein [Thermogymnomonas acidicola]|uniref:glycosyltransferase n=1 Tax=Thermogymnomonas acidicola TaxID=399579 RepID=UPI00094647DF|nr:glycosyltransferase family 2 protein [Thermogymnomonas acidicola]